ncbi:hypothetical protein D6833_09510 [Candidatus Parcubacteria bacterium]|nr:MAG: hypothetical protein D6833_09510 [Candidatus Parcubacteria bacterium]
MVTRWLVSFDTDRIKEYLFATSVLNDVRQASRLLDRLNREDTLTVIREVYPSFNEENPRECVYAAGGSTLIIVPDEETAERAIRAVERLYREKTIAASITGVKVPISDEELQRQFGLKVRWAGHQLRVRKAEKGWSRTLPVAPYMHFCDACAQLPAVHYDPDRDELICRACKIKRPTSDEARRELWEKLKGVTREAPPDAPSTWGDLLRATVDDTAHEKYRSPDDFDGIGNSAKRQGYIALIYADGNRMGQVLEQLNTVEEYSRFARLVDDLLLRVTYRELAKQIQARPDQPFFEVLMAGGDDLMIVTTPDVAFALAIEVARGFEQYSTALVDGGLSLGIGIAIAHARYPIAAMQQLATDLQKRAKRRSFEIGNRSAVDFAVVTAAGSEDLERIRDEVLTEKGFTFPPSDEVRYRLTQRPYTLDELQKLVDHVQKFKEAGFPHSQLHAMYEALFHSPVQASLAAVQTLGRVSDSRRKPHKQTLWSFFQDFGVQAAPVLPPWRDRDDGSRDSALGDLVEVYPFL